MILEAERQRLVHSICERFGSVLTIDTEADRKRFLEILGEACAKTEWQVHALCLMRNHFHLEARRRERADPEWEAIRRGWFFGEEELKKKLLAQASKRVRA